jgi:hypothetical protein
MAMKITETILDVRAGTTEDTEFMVYSEPNMEMAYDVVGLIRAIERDKDNTRFRTVSFRVEEV